MNRTLISLLLSSTLVGAVPAIAQAQSVDQRQVTATQTIDVGLRDGSLTTSEGQQLRNEFNEIARLEAQYRSYGGNTLSTAERNDLETRTDLLMRRIEYYRGNNDRADVYASNPGINERQDNLFARIDAGVRDRSLTQAEAAQLRNEYQDIAQLEAKYRASGRQVTPAERDDLDRRFDQLSSRIQNDRNDNDSTGPSINERQASLDARIDAGVRDRSLTPNEAAQMRAEFQSIARLEAQYRSSGRQLTQTERDDLDRRFNQLSNRIQDNRTNTDNRWINLDQRQAQFSSRLNQAVSDRRVTQQEANSLRSEFNSIASLEAQYRQSRPGITDAERNDLNGRFDRLEANYRYSINNSSYGDSNGQYQSLFDYLFGITSG